MKSLYNKILLLSENEKLIVLLSLLFLILLAIPLLVLGGDVPYPIWDNLDSCVIWRRLMIDNHLIFANNYTPIPQMLSGAPRVALGSELNFMTILNLLIPSIAHAIAVNRVLQMLIGFCGMYLLCHKYIIKNKEVFSSAVVSILFAMVPFWSYDTLSVAGQPLAIFCFLRIRDNKCNFFDYLYLAIFPFFASSVINGIFFYFFLFVVFCRDWILQRKINRRLVICLSIMAVVAMITQYREILSLLPNDSGFQTVRMEQGARTQYYHIKDFFGEQFVNFFFNGHDVLANHNAKIIIIFYFLVLFIYGIKYNNTNKRVFVLLLTSFLIWFFWFFVRWQPVSELFVKITFLRLFQIDRFYVLIPLFLFAGLAYAFKSLSGKKYFLIAVVVLFLFQFSYAILHDATYKCVVKTICGKQNNKITFNEFFSKSLFQDVKIYINKAQSDYRVAALGFNPSVLQYNGFCCIDGTTNQYDVKYKYIFNDLLEDELENNKRRQKYMSSAPAHVRLYDNEIDMWDLIYQYKTPLQEIKSLDVRYDILNKLNCQYIVSAVEIENLSEHLELQQVFENNVYKIYLYKVI